MDRSTRGTYSLRAFVGCGLAFAAACTDRQPVAPSVQGDPRPAYSSQVDFAPGDSVPGCPAPPESGKPSSLPLWGSAPGLVIGVDSVRGLLAVDARAANAPQLKSETALHGRVHQLLVDAAAQVTLALDELPSAARDDVPEPATREPVTRLVRYDASDPAHLRRVAEIALEGEFWRMQTRGEVLWAMSAAVNNPIASCDIAPSRCSYLERTGLIVAGYRFDGQRWQRTQRVVLPMNGQAWATGDGFAAFERGQGDERDSPPGLLHFVHFAGEAALGAPGMLQTRGVVVPGAPLGLTPQLAQLFVLDYTRGGSQLDTYALDSGELLSRVADLPQQSFHASAFAANRVYISDDNLSVPARLLDFSQPGTPRVGVFPAGYSRVFQLDEPTRALGVSQRDTGLGVALFDVQSETPRLIAELAVTGSDPSSHFESLTLHGKTALLSYSRVDRRRQTVALAIDADALQQRGSFDTRYAAETLELGGAVYATDSYGVIASDLASGRSQTLGGARDVLDVVTAGDYQATLACEIDGPCVLELTNAGVMAARLEVGPGVERLVADAEHVLVLSLASRAQCQQSGRDCSDYAPHVDVVTLGAAPQLVATVPLPDPGTTHTNNDDAQQSLDWNSEGDVALSLGHGRFVFVANLQVSCFREPVCGALGIAAVPIDQARVALATPAVCPPNVSSCPPPPAPPTHYGSKSAQQLFLLDAAAATPRLADPVESVAQLGGTVFGRPHVSEGRVLVTRIEREENFGGPTRAPARFMLDRFTLGERALSALTPVNVPGYPVALADGGSILFSIEPDTGNSGAGSLHMLELGANRARILHSLPLDGSYVEVQPAFGKAFYLRRSGVGCAARTSVVPLTLPEDASTAPVSLPELQLPGGTYRIADARDQRLLLSDDGGHYVVLDVSDARAPSVVKFVTLTAPTRYPRLDGDSVRGAGGLSGIQRIVF